MTNKKIIYWLLLPAFIACNAPSGKEQQSASSEVLIIYSTGQPYKTISDITPSEIDAVTCATPADMNCRIIAYRLADELKLQGLTTRVVNASELKSTRDILNSKVLIIGTPARYWGMSWELKKMFDEVFSKIYIAHKDEFANATVFTYSMAEVDGSAAAANRSVRSALADCGNKCDTSFVFLTKQVSNNYLKQISNMATVIIDKIN